MRVIMNDRIRTGICPGVISPAILDTIVQEIGEDSDLRMGIGILKCSVGLAKSDNRASVTLTDIQASIPTVRELHLNIAASILKEEEQKVLETIETLIRQHGEQMNARVLHGEIKKIEKKKQIGYSKFSRFLIRYRDLGLITISRPPHTWGNTRNILTRRTTDPNKKDR
jgi:cell division control protein 6